MPAPPPNQGGRDAEGGGYASRGGEKLAHALKAFGLDVRGRTGADFGCSTGGFTDALLRAGAARVYAIDTAYGQLAWSLRNDPRVVVMERTNCLHANPPGEVSSAGGVDVVVADAGWTPQRLLVPAALRWVKRDGRIVTLVKPHYEARDADPKALPRGGVLNDEAARREAERVRAAFASMGVEVIGWTESPIRGGAHKGKGGGNIEFLALLRPVFPGEGA